MAGKPLFELELNDLRYEVFEANGVDVRRFFKRAVGVRRFLSHGSVICTKITTKDSDSGTYNVLLRIQDFNRKIEQFAQENMWMHMKSRWLSSRNKLKIFFKVRDIVSTFFALNATHTIVRDYGLIYKKLKYNLPLYFGLSLKALCIKREKDEEEEKYLQEKEELEETEGFYDEDITKEEERLKNEFYFRVVYDFESIDFMHKIANQVLKEYQNAEAELKEKEKEEKEIAIKSPTFMILKNLCSLILVRNISLEPKVVVTQLKLLEKKLRSNERRTPS